MRNKTELKVNNITTFDNNYTTVLFMSFRAIDMQGLIGLIGGNVGLVLGYSLLQIPDMITSLGRNFC